MSLIYSAIICFVFWLIVWAFDQWRQRDLAKAKPWYPQATKTGRIIKP